MRWLTHGVYIIHICIICTRVYFWACERNCIYVNLKLICTCANIHPRVNIHLLRPGVYLHIHICILYILWWSAELHANTNSAMLVLIKSTYQETADVRTYVRTGGVGGPGAAPYRSAMSKYRNPTDEYWWFRRACHCLRWWLEFDAGVSMVIFNRLNPCLLHSSPFYRNPLKWKMVAYQ